MSTSCRIPWTACAPSTASTPGKSARSASAISTARSRSPRCGCSTSAPAASALGRDLGLDPGYLSRILRRFEHRGLIGRTPSPADARQSLLHLTGKGRRAFAPLEARARGQVKTLLGRIADPDRRRVVEAMGTIERLLGVPRPVAAAPAPYLLRAHQPGDMGWVIHRHGAIYAREWGYNHEFEALVARICADFLDHFDASGERCWIAERDQAIVGSVFLVRKSKTVAKLRLLLVEPSAPGSASAGG